MKPSSKERLATLLMDELLERLSNRESIRKTLGEMRSLPIDEVIEGILDRFEQAVEEFHRNHKNHQQPSAKTVSEPERVAETVQEEGNSQQQSAAAVNDPQDQAPGDLEMPTLEDVYADVEAPTLPESPPSDHQEVPEEEAAPGEVRSEETPSTGGPSAEAPAQEARVKEVAAEKPKGGRSAASVEPRKEKVPEPTVQFNPIKLEFPKISLKIDVPPPSPPMKKEEAASPSKKAHPSEPKKETPSKPDREAKDEARHRHEEAAGPPKKSAQPESKKEVKSELAAKEEELHRLEELAKQIEAEYELRRTQQHSKAEQTQSVEGEAAGPQSAREQAHAEFIEPDNAHAEEEEIIDVEPVGAGKHSVHARCTFSDDEFVYVHAAGRIPEGEAPSPEPFMLEEKGIDGHGFAFALDYEGMRFYLSKVNPSEMNISRTLVLLLNKQESLQMQGVHESTLNDLRAHGILLPVEFGTVARGKDYLLGLIDKNKGDLEDALDEIEKTAWWTLTASVLDNVIAGIVGTDVQQVGRERSRDRASYTSTAQGKKYEIKVLERILQREKKIAEAIHGELSKIVERCEVETMVGLGSGSSEDWKVILNASYEVPRRDIARFNRTVTDLQYHHLQYDLMLALTGDRDCLALRRK